MKTSLLLQPALVLIAGTVIAAMLTVASGVFGNPAAVAIAAPVLATTVMI